MLGVCAYLGCLWCAGDVHSAGFDSVCFGPLEERKAALPPSAVSVRERAIVPVRKPVRVTKRIRLLIMQELKGADAVRGL